MIQRHLALGGVALIASKKYYFGVGGGTFDLEILVQKHNNAISQLHSAGSSNNAHDDESVVPRNYHYSFKLLQSICDGQSNIREIIEIKKIIK